MFLWSFGTFDVSIKDWKSGQIRKRRRQKKVKRSVFLLILLVLVVSAKANAQYGGGTGDPCDPYLIADPNHLQAIGDDPNNWDKCFKLTADIDMSNFDGQDGNPAFNIIAPDTDPNFCSYIFGFNCFQGTAFTGTFDGDDHTISNLTINLPDKDFAGLFGYVDSGGHITNLVLENVNVTGRHCSGGLMGGSSGGTITNCSASVTVSGLSLLGGFGGRIAGGSMTNSYATGTVAGWSRVGGLMGIAFSDISNCGASTDVSGEYTVGGLVGNIHEGRISNSYATGTVTGSDYLGGLVGAHEYCLTENCYSTGNVTGGEDAIQLGGLVGNNKTSMIINCYSKGSVIGGQNSTYLGGLVGYNDNDYGTIVNCYSTGSVTADIDSDYLGGLVGFDITGSGNGIFLSCFWDRLVNPLLDGISNGSDPNVIGETTENMQIASTFTDAGWDFIDSDIGVADPNGVWRMCVDGEDYPRLVGEYPAGDFVCPDGVELYDYAILGSFWLRSSGDAGWHDFYDLYADGIIDAFDLGVMQGNWMREPGFP